MGRRAAAARSAPAAARRKGRASPFPLVVSGRREVEARHPACAHSRLHPRRLGGEAPHQRQDGLKRRIAARRAGGDSGFDNARLQSLAAPRAMDVDRVEGAAKRGQSVKGKTGLERHRGKTVPMRLTQETGRARMPDAGKLGKRRGDEFARAAKQRPQ